MVTIVIRMNISVFSLSFIVIFILVLSMAFIPSMPSSMKEAFGQASTAGTTSSPPNILFIMGDDLGFSDIGSFGSEIATPNLDAIAAEGKILTNYHTNPVCSPARVSALTGVDNHIGGIGTMYENMAPNQVGKPGYETYINDKVVTIAELLRDAGYHTLMSGKWHLSGEGDQNGTSPNERGFENVFTVLGSGAQHYSGGVYYAGGHPLFMANDTIVERPDNGTYSNKLYTDIMLDQIKNSQGDGKPLFMYLSYQVAHSPFQAPQKTIKKYDGMYDVGYDVMREQRFDKQKELGIWPANMTLSERNPSTPAWENLTADDKAYKAKTLAVHAAMIEDMDQNIGRVIQHLKDTGKYDNTLVLFTSDNGGSEPLPMNKMAATGVSFEKAQAFFDSFNNTEANLGNANSLQNYADWGSVSSVSPFSWFKSTQGEGGVRSPLVMKLPNEANQSQTEIENAFVHVNDLTPTMLDFAGVQGPGSQYKGHDVHPIMGKSLKPLLKGQVAEVYAPDEPVAQEMFNSSAVFMGPWKAMKLSGPPVFEDTWHLYNIAVDPSESNDVSAQNPGILQKLITAYDNYAKDVGVVVPVGVGSAALTKGSATD
jgi:arylsulfatase A-like enzyme